MSSDGNSLDQPSISSDAIVDRIAAVYGSTVVESALASGNAGLETGVAFVPFGSDPKKKFDESGNTLRVDAPGFPPASATYDPRGLLLEETRPDGSVIARKYSARGNLTEYRDETGRVTSYTYDGIGRLARIEYPDGTAEEVRYLPGSGAVHATRDRAGVWIVNCNLGNLGDGASLCCSRSRANAVNPPLVERLNRHRL